MFSDKVKFVVFSHYCIQELYDKIKNRLIQLGYKDSKFVLLQDGTITIESDYEKIRFTGSWPGSKSYLSSHVEGDLNRLFYTEDYKYNQPLMINDYTVKFNKDSITVGCTLVDKETIKKIAEHFFTVVEK